MLHNPHAGRTDPVLVAFFELIACNIAAGCIMSNLPRDLAAATGRVVKWISIDLEE